MDKDFILIDNYIISLIDVRNNLELLQSLIDQGNESKTVNLSSNAISALEEILTSNIEKLNSVLSFLDKNNNLPYQ